MNITGTLSSQYHEHTQRLTQAQNLTSDLLDTIEATTTSAAQFQETLLSQRHVGGNWWPYVICPTASLVMGSYGLPPSAFRNLGLLALGELFGMLVSSHDRLRVELFSFATERAVTNATAI